MKILSTFFLAFFIASITTCFAQDIVASFEPSVFPDRIMLTIPGNPATSRAVSWRTEFGNNLSIGEIAPVNPGPQQEQEIGRAHV